MIEIGKPEEVLRHFLKGIAEQIEITHVDKKETVIRVKNLSKRFSLLRVGEVLKFTDLSLDINAGEITALVGQSGAGKTTLLKMIEGLRVPKEGDIYYLHEGQWTNILEYSRQRMDLRKKISIMHQEFTLSPNSTVREQMAFRLRLKGKRSLEYAREKAAEIGISDKVLDSLYSLPDLSEEEKDVLMRQMNLTADIYSRLFPSITKGDVDGYAQDIFAALDLPLEILDKTPYQISGGEHVRAYIALALITYPEILILDEPFGDLDPVTLRDVTNSLKRINSKMGTTIVLVSHHMDFVREVAHRAILVDNAKIIMDGKPEEVCDRLIQMSDARYLEHDLKELEG
jgi:methyl coenzyme M reductase system subunit A2